MGRRDSRLVEYGNAQIGVSVHSSLEERTSTGQFIAGNKKGEDRILESCI